MPKGLHTASAAVLFRQAPTVADLARALEALGPVHVVAPTPESGWMGENGGVSLPLAPRGRVVVAPFASPWPDGMGDPQADPMLFGAWTMGFFGPFAWPGNLARAVQHAYFWPEAAQVVGAHRGFVRILASHVAGEDDPVIPADYDAVAELRRVTEVAEGVAALPGALAYFDPNGEALVDPAELGDAVRRNRYPLDVWSNVRMFAAGDGWTLMDTVGLGQLDLDDLETVFPAGVDPNAVADMLRNVAAYLCERGAVIQAGHTVPGPGGRWEARASASLTDPDRPVLRLAPVGVPLPPALEARPHE